VLSDLVLGVVVFISTNIDDVLLLAAFFSDPRMSTRAIVLGQFLGIAALVVASVLVAVMALAIPAAWVALLGIVPLALGLQKLWKLRDRGSTGEGANPRVAEQGAFPGSQLLGVAGVTVANGADNLGAYIPLFAADPAAVVIHVATFFVLTGALCVVARGVVRNGFLALRLRRHAPLGLALVLIGLGVWILAGARELL
jgi:cadmium resistance protein CadD (predicted permease)